MAKVIVERPRCGGGGKYPRAGPRSANRLPPEEWRRREGIRRPWAERSSPKYLNENLAPLRRFLRSHAGEPWDDVYSEICQRINRDSAVQLHVWQHLVEEVCTNPYEVTGEVGRRGWPRWRPAFYVDPATGRLAADEEHRRKRAQWQPPAPPDDRVRIDARREYWRIGGIWYELTLERIAAGADWVPDVCLRKRCYPAPADVARQYHGGSVYAIGKRQLNKQEIRRIAMIGRVNVWKR